MPLTVGTQSSAPGPVFVDIEGCWGSCAVKDKSQINVTIGVQFSHDVFTLKPDVLVIFPKRGYMLVPHQMSIPDKFKDIAALQGRPKPNELKTYKFENVEVVVPENVNQAPTWAEVSIFFTAETGKEVMCAFFQLDITK